MAALLPKDPPGTCDVRNSTEPEQDKETVKVDDEEKEQASLEMHIKIDTATAEENAKVIGTTAAAMSDDNTESTQKLVEVGMTKADMKELKFMRKPPVQVRVVVVHVEMFGVCLWALIWLGAGHSGII